MTLGRNRRDENKLASTNPGVKQHVGRQCGVQNVEVSLIDEKVEITPKEDGQIDPIRLLKATYDSTQTVVTVRGQLYKKPPGTKSTKSIQRFR